VSAFARNGRERDALFAFGSMNVRPNVLTLVSALSACSGLKVAILGKSIHGYSLRNIGGTGANIIFDNAILEMYMCCGELGQARRMFEVMPDRDVVSWTTVISGYAWSERFSEAIEVFSLMLRDREVTPNEATLVSMLRACSLMGALRLGKWVHAYLFRNCIGVDTIVGNALIDMYAKCGEMGMALEVFNKLKCKDLVSWCTIIGGMAVHGRVHPAFQLFSLMLCHGFRPDGVAFISVLSACCHAGMVEKCVMFFKSMREVYGIEPQKEHHGCLIDTFGRAGRLEDAEQLICRMPIGPDGHVWGAFMNACKIYGGNEALLERITRHFLGGEVVAGGGTYALLSNMYAKDGKWKESNSVREHMRLRKIRKNVGYSWIEVCRSQLAG